MIPHDSKANSGEIHNSKKYTKNTKHDIMTDLVLRHNLDYEILNEEISALRNNDINIFFFNSIPQTTSLPASFACANKWVTKLLLKQANISTPIGRLFTVDEEEQAWNWIRTINSMIVIKPIAKTQHRGLSLNISNRLQFHYAWKYASRFNQKILVEEMVLGHHYRFLVVGNRFISVIEYLPLKIVGDGIHTIEQLLEADNPEIIKKRIPRNKKNTIYN